MSPRTRGHLLRVAPWVLAVVVLTLIARQARTLDWDAVLRAVQEQSPLRFAVAAALGAASYVFNLNFGALVGGMAMRLRMYTRQGLDAAVVTEVIALSLLTNWLGYLLVA